MVKKTTLRKLIAISTLKGLEKYHIDVDAAYLNSKIKEDVYVEQPEGFEVNDPRDYVFKLKRSLYGLHQSGKNWNEELNKTMSNLGFTRSLHDPCLYFKLDTCIYVGVYVDDCYIFGLKHCIEKFKSDIGKVYTTKDIGPAISLVAKLPHIWTRPATLNKCCHCFA